MGIKQSQYVDTSGFVYLPYISDWEKVRWRKLHTEVACRDMHARNIQLQILFVLHYHKISKS